LSIQTNQDLIFAPASKPQEQFLNSDAFFTLYGGAAFAGKSMCLLGSMLPICHEPGTSAILVRKSTKQLDGSGGLFDAAAELYRKVDPKLKIKTRDLTFVFSSGAKLQMTYLDHPKDRDNFQGKEYSLILLDECQQLSYANVMYVATRCRSTRVTYKPRIIATANPDYDSWLRPWVEFALDERGIPVRKEVYPKRFYYRSGQDILWYDSLEEAEAIHGKGDDSGIKSFCFIPGNIYDNPIGLEKNKDYVSTLMAAPRVEMERLLLGSWYARESTSGIFKREWCTEVIFPNYNTTRRVRSWDLASTKPSEANSDPDWTAGVLMSREKTGVVTVEDMTRIRDRPHVVKELIFDTAKRDGKDTIVTIPLDPGATAGAYCRQIQRELIEMGYTAKLVRPDRAKLQRFRPFAAIAEAGFVNIVEADWNSAFYTELEQFTGQRNSGHDD
jgi:predicted phage terminase large subunit-like protein